MKLLKPEALPYCKKMLPTLESIYPVSICSWSGGKDSCYALMQAVKSGYRPAVLLNVLNEEGKISRSHGIPLPILEAQAARTGWPLHAISSSWQDYEANFTAALQQLKKKYNALEVVFGDIDLQAHLDWEEKVCAAAGLEACVPLWRRNRKELVTEMLQSGIRTIIVSCNETMGSQYIGQELTLDLVYELEAIGIDPCGENGEFHTLVLDCPLFSKPLTIEVTDRLYHDKYWFAKLELKY